MANPKNKTQRVIALVEKGISVKEIVRIAKVSPQLVYAVKSKMRKDARNLEATIITPKEPVTPAIGIAGLSNRPRMIRAYDEPVVDTSKETFWRKVWRIIWK